MNQQPRDRIPLSSRSSSEVVAGRWDRMLPAYKIILHYRTDNRLMTITRAVMDVMRFCREEATHKMWEAYHFGRSQLFVTYLERAEWYAEQFGERGLTVTIEPR